MALTSEQSADWRSRPGSTGSFFDKNSSISGQLASGSRQHPLMLPSDQIPISFCTIDRNAFIRDANEQMCTLFGFSREVLAQKSFIELLDSSSFESVEQILSAEAGERTDRSVIPAYSELGVWFKKADGTIFPGTLFIRCIEDDEEYWNIQDGNQSIATGPTTRRFNLVVVDNTLTHNRLVQVEKDREELRKKELLKDEFLAVASHELKTPIQPILGFALLAKKGLIGPEEAWNGVLQEARRLQQLANDILDVSRIESGSLKYDLKTERINVLLTSIAEWARKDLKEGISLTVNYEKGDEELEVEIDRTRITQLVHNILGNAMKFTEKGYIRIESIAHRQENKIEISISDSGKGLSDEIIPKLFEKFATNGHGSVENNKGTGLGLYISKAIVKGHQGEIRAFNNNDGGAIFLITLPISKKGMGA